MLKEFKIRNFKSFKNEEIFSLEPMNRKEENLDCFNIAEIGKNKILKSAAIYGHNSFGKSNLFKGLSEMKSIIKLCINSEYKIEVDNFKLDDISKNNPTMFEISFILDEITYRYGFEVLGELIKKEWLYKKKLRETKIFERGDSLNKTISLNSKYSKYEKYVEFTKENELFLSSMEKNNVSGKMKELYEYITKNIKVFSADRISIGVTSSMIIDKEIDRIEILKALKSADLGIHEIEVKQEEKEFDEMPEFIKLFIKEQSKEKDITKEKFFDSQELIKHKAFSKEGEILDDVVFDFEKNESEGTKKLYSIIGPIIHALKNGYTLFIDELDSKLHHLIVKYIIELFHDLSINTKNAQLVFNTHDFYLLKEELFRRDQIYFVGKDEYGISSLYSLGDFKGIEKKTNLLANYLAGNFGSLGNIKQDD